MNEEQTGISQYAPTKVQILPPSGPEILRQAEMARKAEDDHGHHEGVVGAEHRFEGDEQTDCQKVGPVDHVG